MKLFSPAKNWLAAVVGSFSGNRLVRRRAVRAMPSEALESRLVLAAPTLTAIANKTLIAGSPLLVALNGADADNDALTFTATISNENLTNANVAANLRHVTPIINQQNRSLKIDVTNFGTMTFQLFEDLAPRVTSRITTLANNDFYNGLKFHRVVNNFVIQGGDPLGNGTGGSGTKFDDQFSVDLQHNQTGILSMAKSSDDTNDSQFFITEGAQRHLDYNHSIFGYLTTGESVRDAISNTPVSSSVPTTPVVMSDVSVIQDTQNTALMLKVPEGTTGSATVTVTVDDSHGGTATQSFNLTIVADTVNSNPFLKDIPKLRTLSNTQFQFNLEGVDVEGNQIGYLGQTQLQAQQISVPQVANANLGYSVGQTSGTVTLNPTNSLTGLQPFTVAAGVTFSTLDFQVPKLDILSAAAPLVVSGADHPAISQSNDGKADTFRVKARNNNIQIYINDALSYEVLKSSVTTLTLNGSNDNDVFIFDGSGGDPLPAGGVAIVGGLGTDRIELRNAVVQSSKHSIPNARQGSIIIDGTALAHSGVESLLDDLVATERQVQYGSAANLINLVDDDGEGSAGNGLSKLVGTAVIPLTFRSSSGLLTINGGGGNDTINATGGDSTLTGAVDVQGGTGNDLLTSGARGDVLNGGGGLDTIRGGDGDDFLFGGAGNDSLDGQGGHDTLGEVGNVNFTLGATTLVGLGTDTFANMETGLITGLGGANLIDVSASPFAVDVNSGAGNDTLIGSAFGDVLNGDLGNDSIVGNAGSDSIIGGNENDTISCGDGDDNVLGGEGDDLINGDAGNDNLNGSGGGDTLFGGVGDDTVTGGDGADRLEGEAGSDRLLGDAGNDVLNGGIGDDILIGGADNDTLNGGAGNDGLSGSVGNDLLNGAAGNDSLFGLLGNDSLIGGTENDLCVGGDGDDTVTGQAGTDTLVGGNGNSSPSGNDNFGFDLAEQHEGVSVTLPPWAV